jgi:hypothetical protein
MSDPPVDRLAICFGIDFQDAENVARPEFKRKRKMILHREK